MPPGFEPRLDIPRSVYVHVPFCRHRCGYCNFALVANRDYLVERYLDAIATEIGWLERSWPIDTMFLGGGTPSHLDESALERLFDSVRSRFVLAENAEVTAECNPSDITPARVALFKRCGINRISLGVQSFNSDKLKRLERDHSPDVVCRAVEQIRQSIDNVSLDLIFATPGESMAVWERDLEQAVALTPSHLSTYELTWEKGTQFWNRLQRKELTSADEETAARMYETAIDFLNGKGMIQYEVSSFASAGHRCRHNLQYWNREPWFAFGPGAARLIDGIRQTNHGSTMQYLKRIEGGQSPVAQTEHLLGDHAGAEALAIALRQVDGVSKATFEEKYKVAIDVLLGSFKATLLEHELAVESADTFRLTRQGMMMCDRISVEIVGATA